MKRAGISLLIATSCLVSLFISVPQYLYAHGFSIYDQGGKAIRYG